VSLAEGFFQLSKLGGYQKHRGWASRDAANHQEKRSLPVRLKISMMSSKRWNSGFWLVVIQHPLGQVPPPAAHNAVRPPLHAAAGLDQQAAWMSWVSTPCWQCFSMDVAGNHAASSSRIGRAHSRRRLIYRHVPIATLEALMIAVAQPPSRFDAAGGEVHTPCSAHISGQAQLGHLSSSRSEALGEAPDVGIPPCLRRDADTPIGSQVWVIGYWPGMIMRPGPPPP